MACCRTSAFLDEQVTCVTSCSAQWGECIARTAWLPAETSVRHSLHLYRHLLHPVHVAQSRLQ